MELLTDLAVLFKNFRLKWTGLKFTIAIMQIMLWISRTCLNILPHMLNQQQPTSFITSTQIVMPGEERPAQENYNKGFVARKALLGVTATANTEISLNRYSFFERLWWTAAKFESWNQFSHCIRWQLDLASCWWLQSDHHKITTNRYTMHPGGVRDHAWFRERNFLHISVTVTLLHSSFIKKGAEL